MNMTQTIPASIRFLEMMNTHFTLASKPNTFQDLALITVLWIIASWPWLVGLHFIPYDSLDQFYPQTLFAVDSIRDGKWPWWNPYQYAGLPVLGDPQSMIFTLHTFLGLLLGEHYTLPIFDTITLLHPFIGGVAVYGIGRSMGVPRAWLLMGTLVFILGGVTTSRLQHVPQILSYGFIPVLAWLLLAVLRRPTISRALILGAVTAFWAANPNQVVFLGGLLLGALALFTLIKARFQRRLITMCALAGLVAGLLLTPIYAAMFEVIAISNRSAMTIDASAWSSFPGHVFASIVMPSLYGNLSGRSWAPTDITQDYLYIGVVPLLFFAFAALNGIGWRNPLILSWLLLILFFALFAMGVHTPLYPFLYHHVPGFDLFRRPADAAYMINFLLAVGLLLIGREVTYTSQLHRGLSDINLPATRNGVLLFWSIALSVPMIAFYLGAAAQPEDALPILYRSYLELAIRVLILSLLLIALQRLFLSGKFPLFVITGLMLFVTLDLSLAGRYTGNFSHSYSGHTTALSYFGHTQFPAHSTDDWLRDHTAPWARVEVIAGSKSMGHSSKARWYNTMGYNPVNLSNYASQLGAYVTLHQPRDFPTESRGWADWRYDVLGLQYVAFYIPTLNWDVHHPVPSSARSYRDDLVSNGGTLAHSDGEYEIWKRPGEDLWLSTPKSSQLGDLEPAPCRVLDYQNVYIKIACDFPEPKDLVLGDIYAPGWIACVDHRPEAIRAYFEVFRSVALPAGRSLLTLRYQPVPFLRTRGSGDCVRGEGHDSAAADHSTTTG